MPEILLATQDVEKAMKFLQTLAKTGDAGWILQYTNPENPDSYKLAISFIQCFNLFIELINQQGKDMQTIYYRHFMA